jgi:hypothetical protein
MNNYKLTISTGLGAFFFTISKAFAQTNAVPLLGSTPDSTGNVLMGIWSQAVNNPASFSVIGLLMVIAWLCDDIPWIDSKYVKHITVIFGMSLYWSFANPETVSKIYPHPLAIYMSNGAICGAFAYLAHWQIVARLKSFLAGKADLKTQTT